MQETSTCSPAVTVVTAAPTDHVVDGFVPENRARLHGQHAPLQDVQVSPADLEVVNSAIASGGASSTDPAPGLRAPPTEAAGGDLPDRSIDSGVSARDTMAGAGSEE